MAICPASRGQSAPPEPGICLGSATGNADVNNCGNNCEALCRIRCNVPNGSYTSNDCSNFSGGNCGGGRGEDPAVNPLTGNNLGGPCCKCVPSASPVILGFYRLTHLKNRQRNLTPAALLRVTVLRADLSGGLDPHLSLCSARLHQF